MHISDMIKFFISKFSLEIDGISFFLITFIRLDMWILLAHIFSLSFANCNFPQKLKLTRIVPVLKSVNASSCDNYRPI